MLAYVSQVLQCWDRIPKQLTKCVQDDLREISTQRYSLSCWGLLWCSRKDELVWEPLYHWLKATEASPPLHLLPNLLHSKPSSPPALPFSVLCCCNPYLSSPSRAASHPPLCPGAQPKPGSLGCMAASYSMSERSQLGRSLMNHFLMRYGEKITFRVQGRAIDVAWSSYAILRPSQFVYTCACNRSHTHTKRWAMLCAFFVLFFTLQAADLIKMVLVKWTYGYQMSLSVFVFPNLSPG